MSRSFQHGLQPYVQSLTPDFNAGATDEQRDKTFPSSLEAAKAAFTDGIPEPDNNLFFQRTQQFYDATMEYVQGVDAMLRKDPQRLTSPLRGADVVDAIVSYMEPFVGFQGKIVVDAYGVKEGNFIIRNVWGKEAINVLLMDTWSRSASPIPNPDRWVTDISGTIRWKFQGNPTLFMGTLRSAALLLRPTLYRARAMQPRTNACMPSGSGTFSGSVCGSAAFA